MADLEELNRLVERIYQLCPVGGLCISFSTTGILKTVAFVFALVKRTAQTSHGAGPGIALFLKSHLKALKK